MADYPAASPVPPLLTPEEPMSIEMSFNPSCQAPVDDPTAVISICHQVFCICPMPEGAHIEQVNLLIPAMSFRLPLSLLLDQSHWQNAASGILDHFSFSSEAYAQLLAHLYILGGDWAEITWRNRRTRLDVAIDVSEMIEIHIQPLFPAEPESMPSASVGQNMKLKEVSEIAAGETCAVCMEELGGSRKEVTETPCSHVFHNECLLPWLSRATTCPLCRSSLIS
ncbi:uncharacterized RING finger protein P32A8.03c-like [Aristolochia californica]|uniref:uncharacterized RING finger protein P32A8.03c-like n=1 Tax=Aristolochia californica TaxID=171875 RepID=UPI0035DE0242